ncbi:MAG: hypothetical protein A2W91_10095 [Bacteroidetes bacterium GWF2_38_335]|nr:MAG: hypothetical protein A2W91_10095 [Bacteroidetes bacterium GWF2_38_335]HBS88024.1 hypothetical protein [Bacteroidales bacterium]
MKTTIVILFVSAILLVSCSKHGARYGLPKFGVSGGTSGYRYSFDERSTMPATETRMVIYSAEIDLKVKNTDSTNSLLKAIAEKYDGYVMTLGNFKSEIRVKAGKLNQAITDVEKLGKLKNKVITGKDVTEEYYDVQIRLENAKKARDRYLELLAKAENVEAALKVEKELERLNGEIDSMEGKINRLSHLTEYSTITVEMEKRVKPGILGYFFSGLYKGVKWLFVRG